MAVAAPSVQVLIVDDEPMIRRSLRRKLEKEGYWCEEAPDADEALRMMHHTPADLVILDIMMPGKSGDQLLLELATSFPSTSFIMSTAVTNPDTIIHCMRNGAHDYICKPFKLDQVVDSVERALAKKNAELTILRHQETLEKRVAEQTGALRTLSLGAIKSLVIALEAKDRYTAGHSLRVTAIALAIAREMRLDSQELDDLRWGALLHDVGKLAVDPAIQNKPGKLSSDEYAEMMMHVQIGPRIVGPVVNGAIVDIIAHHHARYDGHGFGQELKGTEIPQGARILAVADSFDAMNSDRPYRDALPLEKSLSEIRNGTGTQFDPDAARAFLRVVEQDGIPLSNSAEHAGIDDSRGAWASAA